MTAWLGAAADTQGVNPLWHLGVAALTIAFNFGSFAVEYAVIVAQARLLLEVKSRADHLREARYGAEAAGSAWRPRPDAPAYGARREAMIETLADAVDAHVDLDLLLAGTRVRLLPDADGKCAETARQLADPGNLRAISERPGGQSG